MLEWSLSLYHWVEHEFPTNFLGKFYQLIWKQPLRGLSNNPEDWPKFEDPVFKI